MKRDFLLVLLFSFLYESIAQRSPAVPKTVRMTSPKTPTTNSDMGARLGQCTTIRTRREIRDLSVAQRNRFFAAYKKVQESGELNKFLNAHADVENVYNFVHETPLFLPFHRAFLREMEDALAKYLPAGEGIPYW